MQLELWFKHLLIKSYDSLCQLCILVKWICEVTSTLGFHVEIMLFQRAAEQDSISYLIFCTLYDITRANNQLRLFC